MTAEEFELRITDWARGRADVEALVQIGSRVAPGATVDAWSDWDYYLILRNPRPYLDPAWTAAIAPVWSAHAARTPRGVMKMSVVFAGGREADFVLLAGWQMRLVFWAMRHPGWERLMPARLRRGVHETRAFLRASGTRVRVGGERWERRLAALAVPGPERRLGADEFAHHAGAFWQQAVWISKRIARPEPRAAMHALHQLAIDHVYPLLAEEARLAGRPVRAEARKAEQWLDARRQAQTAIVTSPDPRVLAEALAAEITVFEEVARSVAASRGFVADDHTAVAAWLRAALAAITG